MTGSGKLPRHVPLVVATRGDAVESVHYGSIVVAHATGQVRSAVGDPRFPVFTRSSLKPFQALPFVEAGGPAHFGFSPAQVALMCASHSGEPRHLAGVADMLARIGCSEADLACGCHPPLFYATTGTPLPGDLAPTPLHHNCSGKHAGFLAWCRLHGVACDGYLDPSHPLQRTIRARLAALLDVDEGALVAGTDGCSAPNYALPLAGLAHLYARLSAPPAGGRQERALREIRDAMTAHAEMVAGVGRGDLLLMQAAPGDWIAKGGAEGVQAIGVGSAGLGVALKIADGNARALKVAVAAVIGQLGLMPAGGGPPATWRDDPIVNAAGRQTGRYLPVFRLPA